MRGAEQVCFGEEEGRGGRGGGRFVVVGLGLGRCDVKGVATCWFVIHVSVVRKGSVEGGACSPSLQ